ncbi:cupin domain-containing protein [Kordiimonas sp.]|uniref:cupin domain-containing protein n=1 Tax=Kordiimonas sp. TaxID=1970157 RepID=UPI003A92261D
MLKSLCGLAVTVMLTTPASFAGVEELMKADKDILGNPISYPNGDPAEITGIMITMEPGDSNGWHSHPVPTFGYVLSGELTVEYETGEVKVIGVGDTLVEAQHTPHQGHNRGSEMVKIVVFYAGAQGVPNTVRNK